MWRKSDKGRHRATDAEALRRGWATGPTHRQFDLALDDHVVHDNAVADAALEATMSRGHSVEEGVRT